MLLYDPPDLMTRDDLRRLNLTIFKKNPLGRGFTPPHSESVFDNSLRYTYTKCASFEAVLDPEVRIITGRRGSGKSALISVLKTQKHYDYCIECNPTDLRKWVLSSTDSQKLGAISADDYITECTNFFWLLVFRRLLKDSTLKGTDNDICAIKTLLERLNLIDKSSIQEAVVEWANLSAKSENAVLAAASGLLTWLFNRNRAEFKEAIAEAGRFLKEKQVVILIDNPEDYALRSPDQADDALHGIYHNERAQLLFRSLTFAAATFQPKEARIYVKYFMPTEIYRFLSRKAVNWGKIRGSIHALRWEPEELLCMVAKRIRFYRFRCNLINAKEINMSELDCIQTAYKEWIHAFSEFTRNAMTGADEYSWHYVLRHTQLMPRQIIACGNRILEKNRSQSNGTLPASAEEIRNGIGDAETDNAKDSLGIFEQIHGHILEFCEESLGEIQSRLSHEDLKNRIYPAVKEEVHKAFNIHDFARFRRFLCELGIIGRAISDRDTAHYHCALFEDEVHDILKIEKNDILYVHPMFLRHLAIDRHEPPPKAVSPKTTIGCMSFLSGRRAG